MTSKTDKLIQLIAQYIIAKEVVDIEKLKRENMRMKRNQIYDTYRKELWDREYDKITVDLKNHAEIYIEKIKILHNNLEEMNKVILSA